MKLPTPSTPWLVAAQHIAMDASCPEFHEDGCRYYRYACLCIPL